MNRHINNLLPLLLLGLGMLSSNQPLAAGLNQQAYSILESTFAYEKDYPLHARITGSFQMKDQTFEQFAFDSYHGGSVPGFLALPEKGDAPYPVVLLLHGITGKKENWLQDQFTNGSKVVHGLLAQGYAVLALDAQYHGARLVNNDYIEPGNMVFKRKWLIRYSHLVTQTVVDYRRAIDYLESRQDIDPQRMGVLGYSMGGHMAFVLGANEPRVKAVVACVVPDTKGIVNNAGSFAPHLGHLPLLMLMASKDQFYTKDQAQGLFDAIPGNNKAIKFYNSGHSLPSAYTRNAVTWIKDAL